MKSNNNFDQLKNFLNEQVDFYNRNEFIENDPICIPHLFTKKEDIEVSGFFAATFAWGIRKSIINNGTKLMLMMDNAPHDFVLNATKKDLIPFKTFVHRTFNGTDCINFIYSLRKIYINHGGLEKVFTDGLRLIYNEKTKITEPVFHPPLAYSIHHFRKLFLDTHLTSRTKKHVADPLANSTAKRICMYLRWMVRSDNSGVDFGLWKSFSPALLHCPLDVHSGRIARELGLLMRVQNDWKAVVELTNQLKKFDATDPVKYDFALFGIGVNKGI